MTNSAISQSSGTKIDVLLKKKKRKEEREEEEEKKGRKPGGRARGESVQFFFFFAIILSAKPNIFCFVLFSFCLLPEIHRNIPHST